MDDKLTPRGIKVVVAGSAGVGKSTLIETCVSACGTTLPFEGAHYALNIFDNAASCVEDRPKLRQLCYPNTDVFLVCFSTIDRASLDAVASAWLPDIKKHEPARPVLLVGLKSDLATADAATAVGVAEAKAFAEGRGLVFFLCAAPDAAQARAVFEAGLAAALRGEPKPCCTML